ncbi:MAG: ammonium transporter [Oscillospiraceae bacterium]|nr:ammonium transporter [Oscillospiraceae bacterium]
MEFSAVNTIWVLLGAALVFFMQAGFAMVETGFTRAKNAGNIIMKNVMDFSLGTPLFWLVGFGLMFGSGKFIGSYAGIASPENYAAVSPEGVPFWAYLIFQTVFCATAATIVSGAMAERTKFSSYLIYSAVISAVVYPIEAHWIWGGGWLSDLGFHDFAGSTAVHMTGGIAALIGAKVLGARIGKYSKKGEARAIPGHSLTLGALGCFILWFCWFGFNGASTVSMSGSAIESASKIFVTTNIAAAVATVTTMVFTWIRYGKPDVSMTLNGSLAGLVAITAGCDTVSPVSAAIIGIIAGIAVVVGIEIVDQKFKIDDPVGAVGVHCVNGFLGTVLVGIFSDGSGTDVKSLIYGGGFKLLGIQLLGAGAVIVWTGVLMLITFTLIKKTVGLRVSAEEEILGLDATEHGLESSYADFASAPVSDTMARAEEKAAAGTELSHQVPVHKAVTVTAVENAVTNNSMDKYTKLSILCRPNRLQTLQDALNAINVKGITVSNVMGYGVQKGHEEYYRGVKKVATTLLPKVKVEVVVSKVPVETVIEVAKKALYTGNIGDGKIFVYDVEDVVKVRTGERGYDALQDE